MRPSMPSGVRTLRRTDRRVLAQDAEDRQLQCRVERFTRLPCYENGKRLKNTK